MVENAAQEITLRLVLPRHSNDTRSVDMRMIPKCVEQGLWMKTPVDVTQLETFVKWTTTLPTFLLFVACSWNTSIFVHTTTTGIVVGLINSRSAALRTRILDFFSNRATTFLSNSLLDAYLNRQVCTREKFTEIRVAIRCNNVLFDEACILHSHKFQPFLQRR